MSNQCYFTMKIAGRPSAVREMVDMLRWEGKYEHNGLGRVFSFERDMSSTKHDQRFDSTMISIEGSGECANSVMSSMMAFSGWPRTLESEANRLGLCVEIYSSEEKNRFQEHYIIDKGLVVVNEHVPYTEIFVKGASDNKLQSICESEGISKDELISNVNSKGQYTKGGFTCFGVFENLFDRMESQLDREYSPDEFKKDYSVSLWARVGVTLNVSPDTYKKLINGDATALKSVLRGETGKAYIDGETYFPDIDQNAGLESVDFILGRQPLLSRQKTTPVDVKVMVEEGVVHQVLKNKDMPVNVEVVDVDPEYEDYEKLRDYRDEIYADSSFKPCDYSVSNFKEDVIPDIPPEAVVYLVSGSVRRELFRDDLESCENFCSEHKWEFKDSNDFVWNLYLEDLRENEMQAPKRGLDSIIKSAAQRAGNQPSIFKTQPNKDNEIFK